MTREERERDRRIADAAGATVIVALLVFWLLTYVGIIPGWFFRP